MFAVAQAAGTHDLAAAQQKLTELERLNNEAVRQGEISRTRHDAIAASITTIRADLTQLQDEAAKARLQQQIQDLQQQQQQQQQHHQDEKKRGGKQGNGEDGNGGGG
ncbi:hypothetical protein LK09_17605 [Microbacterium mangrovi]|uniref:Uncharacterized protein n=1 Tax=Microbacterium mangrovi TaxID=1348253 RepID=A0A0B1ZXB6_9MICO|nr:hypothetical protein LK09_17605 [Microbacterium mangrovi]